MNQGLQQRTTEAPAIDNFQRNEILPLFCSSCRVFLTWLGMAGVPVDLVSWHNYRENIDNGINTGIIFCTYKSTTVGN